MAPGAGSTRDKDYRAARARCDGAIKCRRQFKPPCGAACGQVELLGLELLGLELLGPRHHPTAAARSRPISRSIGWLRAYDKGIAPRCNNASTARCNRARKNMRSDVRRAGAISGRPRRVHARGAVPTWMSQRSLQRVIVSSAARMQRQTARRHRLCPNCTSRITRHHNPSAARGRGTTGTARGFRLARPAGTDAIGQKTDPPGRGNPGGSR